MTKKRWLTALATLALVAGACSDTASTSAPEAVSVVVPQDVTADEFLVNVILTDTGYEPETIFIPAGRPIRLVLRNRGETEHHYRVAGLIPSDLRWRLEPQLDTYDLESDPEFADAYVDDIEHILHHLTPTYVPFKEESRSGIKPIGNEVHGYTHRGTIDVMTFYALQTGSYDVIDELHPELTGTVVVFDPRTSVTS